MNPEVLLAWSFFRHLFHDVHIANRLTAIYMTHQNGQR